MMRNLIYMVLVLMILTSFGLSIYNTVRKYGDTVKATHAKIEGNSESGTSGKTYSDKYIKIVFDNAVTWLPSSSKALFTTTSSKYFECPINALPWYQTGFNDNSYDFTHVNVLDFSQKDPSFTITTTFNLDKFDISGGLAVHGLTSSTQKWAPRIGTMTFTKSNSTTVRAKFSYDLATGSLSDYTYLQLTESIQFNPSGPPCTN